MEFLVKQRIRSIYGQVENNCGCPTEAVPIYGWPGGVDAQIKLFRYKVRCHV